MNFDPELLKRYRGILYLVLGLVVILVPVKVIYILIGIGLLISSIPNLIVTTNNLYTKNPFIIAVFIKSLLLSILAFLIMFVPNMVSIICCIAGFIMIIGTVAERLVDDKKGSLKAGEAISLVFGTIILLIGGFSLADTIFNIAKIVIGAIVMILALIMIITARPHKVDFQKTIDEYEARYNETHHDENSQNDDIIDVTYEENDENKEDE